MKKSIKICSFRPPLGPQTPRSPADPENRSSGSCSRRGGCWDMSPPILASATWRGWLRSPSCPSPAPAGSAGSTSSLSHCRRRTTHVTHDTGGFRWTVSERWRDEVGAWSTHLSDSWYICILSHACVASSAAMQILSNQCQCANV